VPRALAPSHQTLVAPLFSIRHPTVDQSSCRASKFGKETVNTGHALHRAWYHLHVHAGLPEPPNQAARCPCAELAVLDPLFELAISSLYLPMPLPCQIVACRLISVNIGEVSRRRGQPLHRISCSGGLNLHLPLLFSSVQFEISDLDPLNTGQPRQFFKRTPALFRFLTRCPYSSSKS
jgi:hypothetical protein